MGGYIRARSPEQKQERMKEIMETADRLFIEHSFHGVTLTTIAEALHWSRGNLYKYVTTREEIFLALYAEKQLAFIDALTAAFETETGAITDEMFAGIFARTLSRHQDYLRYHGLLATVIETNVPLAPLTAFKKRSYADRERVYVLLRRQCPGMPEKLVRQLYLTFLYHGCGLYTHTHCGELTARAMEAAGLLVPHDDFSEMFQDFAVMCLGYYKKKTE